jgi:large subunit ribosomal protein L18
MGSTLEKVNSRIRRKKRIRKKVNGTPERPRLSVFRSAKHIYAQIIDDARGKTLAAASSLEKELKGQTPPEESDEKGKIAAAAVIGRLVAERALEKGISKVVFDRNGFMYHGRVKAISEGARKAGLDF